MSEPLHQPPASRSALLGIPVDVLDETALCTRLLTWMQASAPGAAPRRVYCLRGDVLLESRRNTRLATLLAEGDLKLIAGPELEWALALKGMLSPALLSPPQWLPRILSALAQQQAGVFYIGGPPRAGLAWRDRMLEAHPGLRVEVQHGSFEKWGPENDRVTRAVLRFAPHLVLVGLGSPFQEEYVHAHATLFRAPVCVSVGALAEFETGIWPEGPVRSGPLAGVGRYLRSPLRRAHLLASVPALMLSTALERVPFFSK